MRKSVRTNLLSFFLLSFILVSSCKRSTAPLTDPANLQLSVQDVSCTEAWLRLKANPAFYGKTVTLFRGDSLAISRTLTAADTLLYIEGLQPAATYSFRAEVSESGRKPAASAAVTVTTMDTTSHDFSWQTFEFGGQGGSSSFYDVAIIDENDIWAVGEIYTADDKYNAAHWDGEKWELKKVLFHTFCDHGTLIPYPTRAVFFIDNTLLISSGSEITFIKNGEQIKNQCTPVSINKIWGNSSSDLYIVGNHGLIAHYDGQQWQRIESGTTENIQDIWGVVDDKTGKPYMLCTASQVLRPSKKLILNILPDKSVKKGNWPFDDRKPYSVWFKNSRRMFACGDGIFTKNINNNWTLMYDEIPYFMNRLRGTDMNNIYAVGAFGLIAHLNGVSWKTLPTKLYGSYVSVDVKGDLAVTVGYKNRPALLTMIWMND